MIIPQLASYSKHSQGKQGTYTRRKLSLAKPKPKEKTITTDANNIMNQSELKDNTCSWHSTQEIVCEHVTIEGLRATSS